MPYGFALVGTGLPPPLNPWTPNYVSMVPADLQAVQLQGQLSLQPRRPWLP